MANWEESLLGELQTIGTKHKIKDHKAFVFWYIKASENLPDSEILDNLTDQAYDSGADAIIIDHNIKVIKIIQSKFSKAIGDSSFNKDELVKLNKVGDYLRGQSDYNELREYVHKKLKERLDDAIRLIKNEDYKIGLYFITTHKANPNRDLYREQIEIYTVKDIHRKYEEWRHGHTPELGDINIPYLNLIEVPTQPKAYLVNLQTEDLRNEYLRFKAKLFSRNVRIFYHETKKPNKAMKKTLTEEPDNFWYFNNGITILSEKISIQSDSSNMILRNPQIINGCQTVSTLGECKPSNALLFAKVVEIADNITYQNLIDGIIEANNRQTFVDERMLKSNHPLQVKLQRDLEPLGYYFERKEKQYKEDRQKLDRINKLECIKNIDLMKSNISIVKFPQISHANEDDLFSVHFSDVFRDNKLPLDYLVPYLMWKYVCGTGQNHRGKNRKRFHKLASFHVLRLVYDNCPELKNNLSTHEIFRKLKNDLLESDDPIRQLFDISFKQYKRSKFTEIDSGQRDFFKNKDTYPHIARHIPAYLQRQLLNLFND